MPVGNTHFNSDWLSFKNYVDVLISFWCKKKTLAPWCTLFSVLNQGFLALNQHAKTKTHVWLCKCLKTGKPTVITGGKS